MNVTRGKAIVLSCCAVCLACGGMSTHNPDQGTGGAGTDTSASASDSTGAPGAGGMPGVGGAGGSGGLGGSAIVLEFESSQTVSGLGLWGGTEVLNNALPIESGAPERDGNALHISGPGNILGVDLYWHVAFRFEDYFRGVRFWAKSDLSEGQELVITVGASGAAYWDAVAQGVPWPAKVVQVTDEWNEFEVVLADIGISPEQPAPSDTPFSALHFAIAPLLPYDLWLDDLQLLPLAL